MHLDNLKQLLVEELKGLHGAELQLSSVLPELAKEANSSELRLVFEDHFRLNKAHLQRLEEVFQDMNVKDWHKENKGVKTLIQEDRQMIDSISDPVARDAALISAAQRMEHYKIAGYGTAVSFAHQIELNRVADLLQQTLNEEKQADLILSQIAETKVNLRAV